MPLYSTGTQANAEGGQLKNGAAANAGPEVEKRPARKEGRDWCYLFVHHAKVEAVCKVLEKHYSLFIHKILIYKREHKHIRKQEYPTISGLLFVQGDGEEVQHFLKANFAGLHLVNDCSTHQIAIIPDRIMQPFMQVSGIAPTRIRFMPHTFDYYNAGNTLVRITSGVLAGMEGYRIRIARDKCLITSMGGMTVAIGGIYRESFENLDEYVRQRREQLKQKRASTGNDLTPIQAEMDKCFFTPPKPAGRDSDGQRPAAMELAATGRLGTKGV